MTDPVATVTTNPTSEEGVDILAELNTDYRLVVDGVIGEGRVTFAVYETE